MSKSLTQLTVRIVRAKNANKNPMTWWFRCRGQYLTHISFRCAPVHLTQVSRDRASFTKYSEKNKSKNASVRLESFDSVQMNFYIGKYLGVKRGAIKTEGKKKVRFIEFHKSSKIDDTSQMTGWSILFHFFQTSGSAWRSGDCWEIIRKNESTP